MAEKENNSILDEFEKSLNNKPEDSDKKDTKENDVKDTPKDSTKDSDKETAKKNEYDDGGASDTKDFEKGNKPESVTDIPMSPELKTMIDGFGKKIDVLSEKLDNLAQQTARQNDSFKRSFEENHEVTKSVSYEDFNHLIELSAKAYNNLDEAINKHIEPIVPLLESLKATKDTDKNCDNMHKDDDEDDDIEESHKEDKDKKKSTDKPDDSMKPEDQGPEKEDSDKDKDKKSEKSTSIPEDPQDDVKAPEETVKSVKDANGQSVNFVDRLSPEQHQNVQETKATESGTEEITAKSLTPEIQDEFQQSFETEFAKGNILGYKTRHFQDILGKAFYGNATDEDAVEVFEFLNKKNKG